jgi:hypothetical protein
LPTLGVGQLQEPTEADVDTIREIVVRYVIATFEPPCRNYWGGTTYCLEFQAGKQPAAAFLARLRDVAPGIRSAAYCEKSLGMRGQTTDPFIHIRSVVFHSKDEATVDVVAFCLHGMPTVKRVAGEWRYSASVGGWVGCGPVPADCKGSSVRTPGRAP